jgi:hypothetical protein
MSATTARNSSCRPKPARGSTVSAVSARPHPDGLVEVTLGQSLAGDLLEAFPRRGAGHRLDHLVYRFADPVQPFELVPLGAQFPLAFEAVGGVTPDAGDHPLPVDLDQAAGELVRETVAAGGHDVDRHRYVHGERVSVLEGRACVRSLVGRHDVEDVHPGEVVVVSERLREGVGPPQEPSVLVERVTHVRTGFEHRPCQVGRFRTPIDRTCLCHRPDG